LFVLYSNFKLKTHEQNLIHAWQSQPMIGVEIIRKFEPVEEP
jgi:hypothetical protein